MRLLTYDDVAILMPRQINPHLEATTSQVETLCRQYDIWLPNFGDYHTMTAYLYPQTDPERLITINLLMDLLWFIDDYFDDGKGSADDGVSANLSSLFKRVSHTLLTGEIPAQRNHWLDVVIALRERVVDQGGEEWLPRLVSSLHHHLQNVTAKLKSNHALWQQDAGEYIRVREGDSGMYVAVDCVEFARNAFLPDDIWNLPLVQRARRDVTNVGGLINDLLSYHIDRREGSQFNLITVLQLIHGYSDEEALHDAVQIVNSYIKDFYAVREKLQDVAVKTPNVNRYLQGLEDQIGASWYWQIDTGRYRAEDADYEVLRRSVD